MPKKSQVLRKKPRGVIRAPKKRKRKSILMNAICPRGYNRTQLGKTRSR